jgi:hypothetical protein
MITEILKLSPDMLVKYSDSCLSKFIVYANT